MLLMRQVTKRHVRWYTSNGCIFNHVFHVFHCECNFEVVPSFFYHTIRASHSPLFQIEQAVGCVEAKRLGMHCVGSQVNDIEWLTARYRIVQSDSNDLG